MATETFPLNWHLLVREVLAKASASNPTKEVWGVNLPESWMSELQYYQRSGELMKMFGVRAVSFGGKTISVVDEPKKTPKSAKVG